MRGEWGLLAIADGCDDSPGKEERLSEAPVRNPGGGEGNPTPAVLNHRGDILVQYSS